MSQNALAPVTPGFSQTGSRLDYAGTGGEMFGKMIVGAILTGITFGIYLPWFIVGLYRYQYSRTTMKTTGSDTVKFEFTGTGGQAFVVFLVGYLLTLITFGIYGAWFINNLIKFITDNSVGSDDKGTKWKLQYAGTGGGMFATLFVGMLLTGITFGIYMPWFICKLQKHVLSQTKITENGTVVGQLDFIGQGGDLFVTFLVGYLLTLVTFGIYAAWFQVKMIKFTSSNMRATYNGRVFAGDFVGLGGDLFVINLLGMILTMITFGIYMFWYITNTIRFQTNNQVYRELPAGQ